MNYVWKIECQPVTYVNKCDTNMNFCFDDYVLNQINGMIEFPCVS